MVRPVVYHSHGQFASNRNWDLVQVVRTEGDAAAVVPALRRILRSMDPELVLHDPRRLRDVVESGRAQRRFALELMMVFALTALGLAALGVYAVLAFAVGQRRHEFGVRMALGATAGRIRRDVVARGVALAGAGAGVGLLSALVLGRWVRSMVFEVSVGDPRVLAAVTLLVLATAALAGFIPALRATDVEPRAALDER